MRYILILINILLLVAGQIFWKSAAADFSFSVCGITRLVSNLNFIFGGFLYVIATVLWILILKGGELSRVYPMQSLSYIFGALAGIFLFGESITLGKIIGLIFICSGAVIISVF